MGTQEDRWTSPVRPEPEAGATLDSLPHGTFEQTAKRGEKSLQGRDEGGPDAEGEGSRERSFDPGEAYIYIDGGP